jgi:hypothetical protein
MTVTVAAKNQTVLDACDSTTDNDADGTDSVDFKENSASCYWTKRSSGNNDLTFTKASGTWDFSTYTHVRWWGLFLQGSLINTDVAGGIQFGATDGSNTGWWKVSGSDSYPGGWYNFVCNTGRAVDSGTKPTMSAITEVYVRLNLTGSGKNFANTWVDNLHLCDGLKIYGDDAGGYMDLEDVFAVDDTDNSGTVGGWGVVVKYFGIYFVSGELEFGDSAGTNALKFQAKNQTLVFQNKDVDSALYDILVVDNGTGTTEFLLGEKSGTAGISGCTVTVEAIGQTGAVTMTATDADISDFGLYGCSFIGLDDMDFPATSTKTEVLNCSFNQCGQVDPSTCTITNSNFISSSETAAGAVLFDQATHNISSCSFIANTYACESNFDGSIDIVGFQFVNNTYDWYNTDDSTQVDGYNPIEDANTQMYSGSITRVAQQFTGSAGDLSAMRWRLQRVGSSHTEDVVCKLYTDASGTPGTVLATSTPIAASDLSTSITTVEFQFEDEYTMDGSTYWASVEYASGDGSNYINVRQLAAGSGSETCKTYSGSWSAQTYDHYFDVYKDGIITVNATSCVGLSSYFNEETNPGATILVSTVNITITVLDVDQNAIVGVQTTVLLYNSPFTQLMNEDTVTGGIAEQSYNYPGSPVDITWRTRKSDDLDDPRYKARSGIGQIDANGFTQTVILEEVSVPI